LKRTVFWLNLLLVLVLLIGSLVSCSNAPTTTTVTSTSTATKPVTTTSTAVTTQTTTVNLIELKLSHVFSTTALSHAMYLRFADTIYERTKGRVKITVYPAGILNEVKLAFDAVKTGVADIVHHSTSQTPGMQPSIEALCVPMTAKNSWVVDKVSADFFSNFKVPSLKEFADVHILGIVGPSGPSYLVTKDKPIYTLSDIKGLRLIGGGMRAQVQNAWGASSTSLAPPEMYQGIEKGIVDGGLLPSELLQSQRIAEVVKYMTVTPALIYGPSQLIMNTNKWNSLPSDIQQIFNDTVKELLDWDANIWWYSDSLGIDYFLAQPGRKVYEIPAGEWSQWLNPIQSIYDTYVQSNTKNGLQAAEYINFIKQRCDYWNNNLPDKQTTMDWVKKEILKK
jgi:TRAP-type C4-dicarboxylate transport system substrate-binding protein